MIIFDVRSLSRVYNTAKNCECKKTLHRFYIRFIWTLQLLCKMYVKITHQNQTTCVRGNEDKHGYIWRIDNDRRACFVFVWNACDGRWACLTSNGYVPPQAYQTAEHAYPRMHLKTSIVQSDGCPWLHPYQC